MACLDTWIKILEASSFALPLSVYGCVFVRNQDHDSQVKKMMIGDDRIWDIEVMT